MLYRSLLAVGAASLAACATAAPGVEGSDATPAHDSAQLIDAGVDSPPPIDAFCGTIEMELLANPGFDTPADMGWMEMPIDNAFPLIVSTGGAPALSAPNKAWLGGFARPRASNQDQLHQDVTVPANATALVLTGSYWVGSNEVLPIAFDFGTVELATTTNTSLEGVLALDNRGTTTAWTPFDKTFASAHAGQTVRLRMTSSGDDSAVTNFFYDSLSLKATVPATVCP